MGSCAKQTNGGGLALRKCWEPCYGMKPWKLCFAMAPATQWCSRSYPKASFSLFAWEANKRLWKENPWVNLSIHPLSWGKSDLHIAKSIRRYLGRPWFVQDFKSFLCRNESKPTANKSWKYRNRPCNQNCHSIHVSILSGHPSRVAVHQSLL